MDHFFQISAIGPPELGHAGGLPRVSPMPPASHRADRAGDHGDRRTTAPRRSRQDGDHPGRALRGRAVPGIRAAWNEEEHAGLGIPTRPSASASERLEGRRICRQMFDGNEVPVEGRHYRLARPLNQPAPLHRIPILVGGGGEKKTCASSPSMPTPAISSTWVQTGCGLGTTCWPSTVRPSAETLPRSSARCSVPSPSARPEAGTSPVCRTHPSTSSSTGMARWPRSAPDTVIAGIGNNTDDAAYDLVAELVRQLARDHPGPDADPTNARACARTAPGELRRPVRAGTRQDGRDGRARRGQLWMSAGAWRGRGHGLRGRARAGAPGPAW